MTQMNQSGYFTKSISAVMPKHEGIEGRWSVGVLGQPTRSIVNDLCGGVEAVIDSVNNESR